MKQYLVTPSIPPFGKPDASFPRRDPSIKVKVYDALLAYGENGADRQQLAKDVGITADRVTWAISLLRKDGLITVKGAPVEIHSLSANDAKFYALEVLEGALTAKAREMIEAMTGPRHLRKLPADMDKAFVRYNAIKARALEPPMMIGGVLRTGEIESALRLAVIELVKLIF